MRSDERNFRRDNDNRYQDYDRDRDRRFPEDRDFGYGEGMSGQGYDRSYDRGGFNRERDINRGYESRRIYNRGPIGYGGTEFDQDLNYNRQGGRRQERFNDAEADSYGRGNRGQFHSTETDRPGRGYDNEWEMNRNANDYEVEARNRGWGRNRRQEEGSRGYDQRNRYGVSSSHAATGPYEDYERDLDRYGIRDDYERDRGREGRYAEERRSGYGSRRGETGRYDYDQSYRDRNYMEGAPYDRDRNFRNYYQNSEEAGGRRRLSNRIQDRGLERSQSGNWGPSDSPYQERNDRGRENY